MRLVELDSVGRRRMVLKDLRETKSYEGKNCCDAQPPPPPPQPAAAFPAAAFILFATAAAVAAIWRAEMGQKCNYDQFKSHLTDSLRHRPLNLVEDSAMVMGRSTLSEAPLHIFSCVLASL